MRAMEECILAWLMNGNKYEVKYNFKYGEYKVYKNDVFDWDWPGDETPDIEQVFEEVVNRYFYPEFTIGFDSCIVDTKERITEQERVEIQDQIDRDREYAESRGV